MSKPGAMVRTYTCRTHRWLFRFPCWHGQCLVCRRGITAFDWTQEDARAAVLEHLKREHHIA